MKKIGNIAICVALTVSASAGANEIEHNGDRDTATGVTAKQTIDVDSIPLSQVFCMKKRRTGSRVTRNVCQTLAEWKHEMEARAMRQAHLMRPQGARASWE